MLAGVLAATSCSGPGGAAPARASGPDPVRGRQVYASACIACHSPDPAVDGPLGPAVKGSSRELLDARVLRAAYPPGYVPKRPTQLMVPIPLDASQMDDLAAFLE